MLIVFLPALARGGGAVLRDGGEPANLVNRSRAKSPQTLGFRGVDPGGRDGLLKGQWRRERTWDPTLSV